MQPEKIEPRVITVRESEAEEQLPEWLRRCCNMVFWFTVILFFKAFVDAVDLSFR